MALAATLVPLAVAAVALVAVVGGDYHPMGDFALAELRTRDVGRHATELGPWSRDDWYHPGPALFYLLALPYRLTGGASTGILLGALLVNGAAVAGMALVARRLAGPAVMVATLGCCGVLLHALGPDFARDPWNPTITVLPFGLMLFLAWAMTCGQTWALPAGAAVASFVAQTHVGYVVLALPLLAWGAAWLTALAVRTRRPRERAVTTPVPARALGRAGVLAAVVIAVVWAPPLLQELHGDPGNLTAIWRYMSQGYPGHGVADGLRVLAPQLALAPEWIAGPRPLTLSSEPTVLYLGAPVPWVVVPLALAAVVLVRRAGPPARRLLLTLALATGLGVVSVAQTTGLAYAYRTQWTHVLGMTTGVLACWAAWLVLGPRVARLRPLAGRLPAVAVATVVAVAAVNAVGAAAAGVPDEDALSPGPLNTSEAVGALTRAVTGALPPGRGPVVVVPSPRWISALWVNGVLLGLERAGVDARIASGYFWFGEHRLHHGGPTRAEVVVAVDHDIETLRADPSLVQIAQRGHVPPAPPPDDVTTRVEDLLVNGTIEQIEGVVRVTAGKSDQLRPPWTVHAVAAFLRTTP